MKKVMMVVGVAACVTLVGCKHDEYGTHKVGNKVKPVETVEVAADEPVAATEAKAAPADTAAIPAPTATAVAPAKSEDQAVTTVTAIPDAPAKDEVKTVAAKDAGKDAPKTAAPAKDSGKTAPAAEPEFTPYVVRGGDTLGGICHKYKVKKADVLALNPGMDPNKIFVGRTIKLPGNIEEAKSAPAPKAAAAKDAGAKKAAPAAKREYKPYTGETKEYVVKAGDTIGAIAYSNGINIRQFKELNGLSSDVIRVGQKVKIPAVPVKSEKPAAVADAAKKAAAENVSKVIEEKKEEIKPVADKPAEEKAAAKAEEPKLPEAAGPVVEQVAAPAAAADIPPSDNYTTYTVKQGDDLYSVAIKWSVTASQLKEANNLADDTLTPGQVLKVPAKAE